MITDKVKELGKILKQRRVTIPLTLTQLAAVTGVSTAHLGRIERGDRFPSAHVLGKIAKHLGFGEAELFVFAGYLPQPSAAVETEAWRGILDPYVVGVLSQEPIEVQRIIIGILSILKSMAKGNQCDIEFREYAHRKYPQLDDDVITMIEDILGHLPGESKNQKEVRPH